MPKLSSAAACGLVFMLLAARALAAAAERTGTCVDSPQALLTVCVAADARGPWYEVYRGDRTVIDARAAGPGAGRLRQRAGQPRHRMRAAARWIRAGNSPGASNGSSTTGTPSCA